MRRTRPKIKDFDKFPEHQPDENQVLEDTRKMDYMSKFRDWHVKTVFYLALLGMTNEQMAHVFEITPMTFQTWLKKFDTFREAVRKGKEQADAQVVYSLYQAALGFEHPSEQIFLSKERIFNDKGKVIKEIPKVLRVPITKKYPPNVKAAIKWLETRQPANWTNREKTEKQINVKHEMDFSNLSLEELRILAKLSGNQFASAEEVSFETMHTTTQKELAEQRFDDVSIEPEDHETEEGQQEFGNHDDIS